MVWTLGQRGQIGVRGPANTYGGLVYVAKVTGVRVYLNRDGGNGNVKAFTTVYLDDEYAIHGIKVVEGEKGLFISMPQRKSNGDEYLDVFHPVKAGAREALQQAVLEEYQAAVRVAMEAEERKVRRLQQVGVSE